jgi:hypothetical protein
MARNIDYFSATLAVCLVIAVAAPFTARAVGIPFGGRIVAITPCLGGSLVVATILQPPLMTPISVAALPSPFLYNMMSHPGQQVLGMLGPPTFCATAPHRGFTAPTSVFYGTSM